MAFELTERARLLLDATGKSPQIILRIDGIPIVFGALQVESTAKFGSPGLTFGQAGLFFGGVVDEPNSRDYISLTGTTNNVKQQLLQDQGGTSSVSSMKVRLINKNREVSDLFVPGVNVDDLIGRNAEVFFSLQGESFPEDATKVFSGVINSFAYPVGAVDISIAHPEELKRQEVFENVNTELDGSISDTDTTISVLSVTGILATADAVTTHVRIDDELLEVTGIDTGLNELTVVRGALATTAVAHDDEAEVSTDYQIESKPIELALKLMLSGGDEFFTTESPLSFVSNEGSSVDNAIFFDSLDIQSDLGLTVGDIVDSEGATNPENVFSGRTIINFGQLSASSYIVVNGDALVVEGSTSASIKFKSQYNVLSDGLDLKTFPC